MAEQQGQAVGKHKDFINLDFSCFGARGILPVAHIISTSLKLQSTIFLNNN